MAKKRRTAFYTARVEKELVQEEVARLAGVRQSVVSELETGAQTNPTWDVLSKVAQVLGVRPDQLLPPAKLPRVRPRPARVIGAPLYAEGIPA
jgi:transcriptional regulator with XRE-family HTH domain